MKMRISGYPRVPPYQPTGWSPFDPHPKVRLNQEAQIKREHERRHRKRRKSGDYESTELTQGRLLVNKGRPEEDPDVFVATHLTDILQPHQLGGVRFMCGYAKNILTVEWLQVRQHHRNAEGLQRLAGTWLYPRTFDGTWEDDSGREGFHLCNHMLLDR